MKVRVTFLAAPWPEGTEPGHVVELVGCDALPAWALGKCEPAADDAAVISTWVMPGAPTFVVNPAMEGKAEAAPVAGSGDDAAPPKRKAKATG